MRTVTQLAGAAALALLATQAYAEYPERPITVINPNSAGGGSDVGIRTWQPYVEKCLGNGATLVPTAMPGAASAVGNVALAQATPDGYTMGQTNMPNLVSNRLAKPELPAVDDFIYLGTIVAARSTFSVLKDNKLKDFKEAVEYMKGLPQPINVGLGGIGADDHLAGLQIEKATGIDFNFIPFGDGNQSRNALLGGQVEFAMLSNIESSGFRDSVRPLAVASPEPHDPWPDIPTFRQQGYDIVAGSTHVLAAPKGFPEEYAKKWAACLEQTAKDPAFLADAKTRNLSLGFMNAEETTKFQHDQLRILTELWEAEPWVK